MGRCSAGFGGASRWFYTRLGAEVVRARGPVRQGLLNKLALNEFGIGGIEWWWWWCWQWSWVGGWWSQHVRGNCDWSPARRESLTTRQIRGHEHCLHDGCHGMVRRLVLLCMISMPALHVPGVAQQSKVGSFSRRSPLSQFMGSIPTTVGSQWDRAAPAAKKQMGKIHGPSCRHSALLGGTNVIRAVEIDRSRHRNGNAVVLDVQASLDRLGCIRRQTECSGGQTRNSTARSGLP